MNWRNKTKQSGKFWKLLDLMHRISKLQIHTYIKMHIQSKWSQITRADNHNIYTFNRAYTDILDSLVCPIFLIYEAVSCSSVSADRIITNPSEISIWHFWMLYTDHLLQSQDDVRIVTRLLFTFSSHRITELCVKTEWETNHLGSG